MGIFTNMGKCELTFSIITALVLGVWVRNTMANIHMQPYSLRNLFYREETIIHMLKSVGNFYKSQRLSEYLEACSPRMKELPLLDNLDDEENHLGLILEMLVGNPIHVYSLIMRLTMQLGPLRQEMSRYPMVSGIEKGMTSILRQGENPDANDMEGVTQSLARIQFAYRLDPLDMASGVIAGVQTEARLSPIDMINIAMRRNSGMHPIRPGLGREFALAIEWAEAAKNGLKKSRKDNKHLEDTIHSFINQTKKDHDLSWKAPEENPGNLPNEEFFIRKIGESSTGIELRDEEAMKLETQVLDRKKDGWFVHDFNALCRGEEVNMNTTSSSTTDQRCHLTTNNDPYFILAPLKLEIISIDPVLFMYHDILTDGEMDTMKHHGFSQLVVSAMEDTSATAGGGAGAKVTNGRTQSNAWVWDHQVPLLHKLSLKTGKMSNLTAAKPVLDVVPGQLVHIVESEAWQVGIYGPGGHYLPHYDSFESLDQTAYTPSDVWVGNRIATVMFYISDVTGGSTAFPKIGLATRPRKGSAVFWYNLDDSGKRNNLSLHGACPTALGIKWVSNKWIREGAQAWTRPCKAVTPPPPHMCDIPTCSWNRTAFGGDI